MDLLSQIIKETNISHDISQTGCFFAVTDLFFNVATLYLNHTGRLRGEGEWREEAEVLVG